MTGRNPTAWISSLRLQRRMLAALTPAQVKRLIRTTVVERVRGRLGRFRRKAGLYLVRGIEKLFGSDRAHAVYWRLWPSVRGWPNTENRLRLLADENPEAIPTFVQLALRLNRDPVVLMGLARNPHSRDALATILQDVRLTEDNPLTSVIRLRQQYAATFISVVQLLLKDTAAEALVSEALLLHRVVPDTFLQIICSAGTRVAAPSDNLLRGGVMKSGFRQTVNHRLVIVDDYKNADGVAQLFVGATNVTVLALTDLLGRADFSRFVGLGGVESIVVEHLRTRVSRFSQTYVENHEATRDVGRTIATALMQHPGLLDPTQHTYMSVAIADFLHFQCLKIAAVSALLADTGFDHIVIGTANHVPHSEYFRLLAGVPCIATDPRVELVSIAWAMAPKTQFGACLATLTGDNPLPRLRISMPTATTDVLMQIQDHAESIAERLQTHITEAGSVPVAEQKPQILLVTSNNPAYNASTAGYAAALAKNHPVTILHVGARASALQAELNSLGNQAAGIVILPVPASSKASWDSTRYALVDLLWQVQQTLPETPAAHIVRINAERLVTEVISPQLINLHAMDRWFSMMKDGSQLPGMVILAPARMPQIAAMTTVARKFGVPTLTLEAHGLNANYSRYLKVTTDYYGVVSGYFRKDAEAGFAIPADRIAVVGTPRIVAPAEYDPQQAQADARALLAEEQGIVFGARRGTISFFCQPSAWEHVALVWCSVLRAAQVLELDVLLKTHPEETPTRKAAYLGIAESLGMAGQVFSVTGPPTPVIAASDVVLTGYSAAALDAAVLQVPVICVTEGAVDYPVDQHAMIDGPLVRSTEELQRHLGEILSDPVAARTRVMQFLQRERQFVEGPDNRLRMFVADILARPKTESIRPAESVAASVFLDSPHPTFPV
jgi:hypothetical protein